ncbi:MAG: hypothetical protein ILP10_04895, partial [Lachnospiraceae bacterium]|nr:hypothetical protein [Lachnospiraceae bacterium]
MTKIKLCGLGRAADIAAANSIGPEFIGFVFAKKSRRYVSPEVAEGLKSLLREDIMAVGVFVDEDISVVKDLLDRGVIDVAQLHGAEDEVYIKRLKDETGK